MLNFTKGFTAIMQTKSVRYPFSPLCFIRLEDQNESDKLSQIKPQKQHHTIEIFSANCLLCKEVTDIIEIGRCQGCKQIVYDTNNMTEEIKMKMKNYDVRAVPTTIMDGEIRVVGIPDFPWICGDELYKMLKTEYQFKGKQSKRPSMT